MKLKDMKLSASQIERVAAGSKLVARLRREEADAHDVAFKATRWADSTQIQNMALGETVLRLERELNAKEAEK